MIAWLEGKIVAIWSEQCLIVTASGIGFQVHLPVHTWLSLPEIGSEIGLYIAYINRENEAPELYGFSTLSEKLTFNLLKNISRIGPKTALAILSTYRPEHILTITQDSDLKSLKKIPGIGGKTAEFLLLELKSKLPTAKIIYETSTTDFRQLEQSEIKADTKNTDKSLDSRKSASILQDVLSGLASLGYEETEALPVVKEVLRQEPDLDLSSALRACLKTFAKNKENL